jgi:hypothetical protein
MIVFFGLVLVGFGIYFVIAAFRNSDLMLDPKKARSPLSMLPRRAARISTGILGLLVIVLGIMFIVGVFK